jgi:hypothetical protein
MMLFRGSLYIEIFQAEKLLVCCRQGKGFHGKHHPEFLGAQSLLLPHFLAHYREPCQRHKLRKWMYKLSGEL